MTIYFANAAAIDLAAIEIMGVSVKEGASPIGYFGTGLKFAIATILREGGQVKLWRQGQEYNFVLGLEVIRGKNFDRVFMKTPSGDLRPLGFTSALGRNWLRWKAFRELESNCRDEGGVSGPTRPDLAEFGTVFEIEGLDDCWVTREEIFLASEPLLKSIAVEIHPLGKDPKAVYYRGVLAGTLSEPGAYTYNVLENATLTEDRTIESMWWAGVNIALLLAQKAPKSMLAKTLLRGKGSFEGASLHTWPETYSDEFSHFIREHLGEESLNGGAKSRWLTVGDNEEGQYVKLPWTAERIHQTVAALTLTTRMSDGNARLSFEDINLVSGLGPNVYGLAKRKKIYISPRTYDMGTRFLASTIYEEWLHVNEGLGDESRSMQNWLFERLATMAERLLEIETEHGIEFERKDESINLSSATMPERSLDDDIPF